MLLPTSYSLTAALLFSVFGALALGKLMLPVLRQLKAGQTIREEMHAAHQKKAGTPTMGGLIFVVPAAVATLLFAPRGDGGAARTIIALILMLGHGLLGFADDYIKVVLKRPLGLRAREKLLAQVFLAAVLGYGAVEVLHLGTVVTVPYINYPLELGRPLYYLLVLIIVWGTANTVNFTDGLDGLLAGTSIIVFGFYAIFVAAVKGQMDLAVLGVSLVGGSFGFLRYNSHPAKVFMGDVGSFALGGALAAIAVLTKTELLLVVAGGIFVIEGASVILQVVSFRLTGRRIFKMAPLHHHFELLGWGEDRILKVFWTVSVVLVAVAWFALPRYAWVK